MFDHLARNLGIDNLIKYLKLPLLVAEREKSLGIFPSWKVVLMQSFVFGAMKKKSEKKEISQDKKKY